VVQLPIFFPSFDDMALASSNQITKNGGGNEETWAGPCNGDVGWMLTKRTAGPTWKRRANPRARMCMSTSPVSYDGGVEL